MAHAFIDAIANAGADAVKFQTHIASAESTPREPWRTKFSPQDGTRQDYWRRTAFTEEQWTGLRSHAGERGLCFLSSPFSIEAARMLMRVGVAAWKIASGEVGNAPLIELVGSTRLPVLMSTGMSPLSEIDAAVERLAGLGADITVLQCTSAYPCPPERVGLNMLQFFRERYGCEVGLSDHSGRIYAGLAAATLGAKVLEVHVTLSRESFGPDVSASLTTAELRQLVEGTRFIEDVMRHPADKDQAARDATPLRQIFTKSIVASHALMAGAVLGLDDLAVKKPGTGIPANRLPDLLGRRLRRSVEEDEILDEERDLAPAV